MSSKIQDAERPWLEGFDLRRQAELIRRARTEGVSEAIALGLAGWLAVKAADMPDETDGARRARYRKILRELGAPTSQPGGRRSVAASADGNRAMPGQFKSRGHQRSAAVAERFGTRAA